MKGPPKISNPVMKSYKNIRLHVEKIRLTFWSHHMEFSLGLKPELQYCARVQLVLELGTAGHPVSFLQNSRVIIPGNSLWLYYHKVF